MNQNSTAPHTIILFALVMTGFLACKKNDIAAVKPHADFVVKVVDPSDATDLVPAVSSLIDSTFHFFNYANSGNNFRYHWDFGDGTYSNEQNPKHSYGTRGTYTVTLVVSNENNSADTSRQTLTIRLGQRFLSFSNNIDLNPIAITETPSNDFLVIAGNYTSTYLFQLDSSFKKKAEKTFPSTHRFATIQATDDANYILTGSTHAFDKNDELVKMTPDGTILWSKQLVANDVYSHVAQAPDGGYIVTGSRRYVDASYSVVIKTDNNGNIQWEKDLYADKVRFSEKTLLEQDGIVLPGIKRSPSLDYDSVFLVKWNHNGSLAWKSAVIAKVGNHSWGNTHITRLKNGNYAVANTNVQDMFFFSSSGTFLDRTVTSKQVADILSAADGNIIVLYFVSDNGFQYGVAKLRLDGTQQWTGFPTGGTSLLRLRRGGILATGSVRIDDDYLYNGRDAGSFIMLDEDGNIN